MGLLGEVYQALNGSWIDVEVEGTWCERLYQVGVVKQARWKVVLVSV